MIFLSGLVIFLTIYNVKISRWLQRDEWFLYWLTLLFSRQWLAANKWLLFLLAVVFPVLLLATLMGLVVFFLSENWLFFIYVPILLYSLGRGNLAEDVAHYQALSQRGDTVAAAHWVDNMGYGIDVEGQVLEVDDWQKLHTQALDVISYRAVERLFAVVFWFFIVPGVGAFLYRLSVLYHHQQLLVQQQSQQPPLMQQQQLLRQADALSVIKPWLWLLEWPVVRALGLTLALVGNFDSCYLVLKKLLCQFSISTVTFISASLRGALGMTPMLSEDTSAPLASDEVNELPSLAPPIISGINTEPDSYGLIAAGMTLFSRTLLLWLCIIALVVLAL